MKWHHNGVTDLSMSVTLISVSHDTIVSNNHEEWTRHYYVNFQHCPFEVSSSLSIPHVTLSGEGIVMHCCCWPSPCIVIIIVCRPFDLQRPCCHYLVGALLVIGHQSSPAASVVIIHCHHVWREGKGGGQHHHSLVGLVGCWSSCMEGEPGGWGHLHLRQMGRGVEGRCPCPQGPCWSLVIVCGRWARWARASTFEANSKGHEGEGIHEGLVECWTLCVEGGWDGRGGPHPQGCCHWSSCKMGKGFRICI